jgi:hypothetical protein
MKIQVKCKNKLSKTIIYTLSLGFFIGLDVFMIMNAVPEDFWEIFAIGIVMLGILIWAFVPAIGKMIVNSIEIDGDNLSIKKFFKSKAVIKVSEIKKYTISMKKMNKGPRRECLELYYNDTFIELYEDNVCNYEVLLDYLKQNNCIRDFEV